MEHNKEGDAFKSSTVDYGNNSPNNSNDYRPTEEVPQEGKFKRNCRKYWWMHLISIALSTLVISLLLYVVLSLSIPKCTAQSCSLGMKAHEKFEKETFKITGADLRRRRSYVALPAIAQKNINDAEMYMEQQVVADPTPDMVTLHIVSRLITHTPFKPDIDAFNVSLFLEDTLPNIKPFGMITIPKSHSTKNFTQTVTQKMRILDQEQFNRYNLRVTQAKSFRLAVRGKTKIHLGALPAAKVDFNKVVEMKGLNSLNGVEVKDIKIALTPDSEGNNMNGTIKIPNPSVMTLTVGDLVQEISAGGEVIGNATVKNVVLKPGDNYFPMVSATDQEKVIKILNDDKTKSGILAIEAKAKSVTYQGQHLPYFEYAMSRVPVKIALNLKEPLTAIGLNIFGEDGASSPPQ